MTLFHFSFMCVNKNTLTDLLNVSDRDSVSTSFWILIGQNVIPGFFWFFLEQQL